MNDTVKLIGIKNGIETVLGEVPMPARMKAKELAREQFGGDPMDDCSDAALCYYALEQIIEYMEAQMPKYERAATLIGTHEPRHGYPMATTFEEVVESATPHIHWVKPLYVRMENENG